MISDRTSVRLVPELLAVLLGDTAAKFPTRIIVFVTMNLDAGEARADIRRQPLEKRHDQFP